MQSELFRCVLDPDGMAQASRVAPGRGAWLCGLSCLDLAISRKGFERAWRTKLDDTALAGLAAELVDGVTCQRHHDDMRD